MELLTVGNYRPYLQVEKWLAAKGCTEIFWDREEYPGHHRYYHYKYQDHYHAFIRKTVHPYTIYIFKISPNEVFGMPIFYHYLETGKVKNVLDDWETMMRLHLEEKEETAN